ncbi:hypothetical protein GCM10010300_10670 [Streptomyces olivaceoviridis]|nr:hypothetical protein GCM10010300_10670 [Streptomyces olivaceoviridis]
MTATGPPVTRGWGRPARGGGRAAVTALGGGGYRTVDGDRTAATPRAGAARARGRAGGAGGSEVGRAVRRWGGAVPEAGRESEAEW